MKPAVNAVLLAACLATGPFAAAILSATSTATRPRPVDVSFLNERGGATEVDGSQYDASELTPVVRRPWDPRAGVAGEAPVRFEPPWALPPHGPSGFAAQGGPPPPSRAACEEDVDRLIGLAAYLRSRMHLLRAVHEPLQALHEMLSSDQRALLTIGLRLLPSMPTPPDPLP